MQFLTDFADQAVILPVAAAVLLGLLVAGWWRGGWAWGGCVAGVLAAILALKLVGFACGDVLGWRRLGLVSPSGHTASACVVYGGLAALLVPRGRMGGVGVGLLAGAVALLAGATRLELGVHTPLEVCVGAMVGLIGAVAVRGLAGPPPARVARPWLLGPVCVVMVALHGHRLAAETGLRWIALDVWPLSLCEARPSAAPAGE